MAVDLQHCFDDAFLQFKDVSHRMQWCENAETRRSLTKQLRLLAALLAKLVAKFPSS